MDAAGLLLSCLSIKLFLFFPSSLLSPFSSFVLCLAVLRASDLHPLIHELLLPKSCLSSWEISPTSCVSIFFSSSHSPPPTSASSFLSRTLLPWPHFFFLSHTPVSSSLLVFFCRRLVSHSFSSSAFCVVWFPFLISVTLPILLSLATSFLSLCEWACEFVCIQLHICCCCTFACACLSTRIHQSCLILQTQKDYRDYRKGQH